MFIRVNGRTCDLWRVVNQEGEVLDILVQHRRDQKAAKRFFRKLLKGLRDVPSMIMTDHLRSDSAAKAVVMPGVEHRRHRGQNNWAENSHQPTRLRERMRRRFKSAGHAQRFHSAFGVSTSHFRPGRHLSTAAGYREVRQSRCATWAEVVDAQSAARREPPVSSEIGRGAFVSSDPT